MQSFSHLDDAGRARMVDVGAKKPQRRTARASGCISLPEATLELLKSSLIKKGDVLAVAQVAGIQAAKRTAELIPLCHSITLDHVSVALRTVDGGVEALSEVSSTGRTGVEMEALAAVSVALLTVYDMCKSAGGDMVIGGIRLLEKVKTDVSAR